MLVSSQTAVKDGHGFEIAVRMDNLRGGDWARYKIAPIVFEVCTRDQACFQALFSSFVFMCLISPTQKFKLEKSAANTKE